MRPDQTLVDDETSMADREPLTAPTGIVRVQGRSARRSPRPTRAGRGLCVTQSIPRGGKGVNVRTVKRIYFYAPYISDRLSSVHGFTFFRMALSLNLLFW